MDSIHIVRARTRWNLEKDQEVLLKNPKSETPSFFNFNPYFYLGCVFIQGMLKGFIASSTEEKRRRRA